MRALLVIVLLCVTFFSCNDNNNQCGTAYFGGEIINANNDHIVFYNRSDEPLDTIYLDENNRFSLRIENLEPGLHSFVHGGETQSLVLEANDSILIRLNTLEFDESLVFTGNGAKKNNFLIDLFNTFEEEERKMFKAGTKSPEEFSAIVDSLKNQKKMSLDHLEASLNTSPLYNKIATASINYNYFSHLEQYPFRHFKPDELNEIEELPEEFYNFRAEVSYDEEDIKHYYTYYNFLFPHINNLALQHYFKKDNTRKFDANSLAYNQIKLFLIDSLISNAYIKNNMLKHTTRNFLSYNSSIEESKIIYDEFHGKCSDQEHKEYMDKLYANLERLRPGNPFPSIELLDHQNQLHHLKTIVHKPTVIYFWSKAIRGHFKESHERVNVLKETYPELDFISININPTNTSKVWRRLLNRYNFSLENEYRFMHPDASKKILALNYINKVMVVDSNNNIIASNAYMFSPEFKELLAEVAADNTLK